MEGDVTLFLIFVIAILALLVIGGAFADSWERRDAKRRNGRR